MNNRIKWVFLPLDDTVHRDQFDCGIFDLNEYLKKYAKQNHKKGIATTYVAIYPSDNRNVLGYYSVSMSEIKRESLPESYRKKLPKYPIPAMLIGKLAVDKSMQGQGLGKMLLMQCFQRGINLSSQVGIFALKVDASNTEAKNFYLKYGFIPLENNPLSLFIPVQTLLKLTHNSLN